MNMSNVLKSMGKYEEALVELKKGLDVLVTVRPRAPGRSQLLPEYCCNIPKAGKRSKGNRDVH